MEYTLINGLNYTVSFKEKDYNLTFADYYSVNINSIWLIDNTKYEMSSNVKMSDKGEWQCSYAYCLRKYPHRYIGNFRPKTEFRKNCENIMVRIICENQEVIRTAHHTILNGHASRALTNAKYYHEYYTREMAEYQEFIQRTQELECEGIISASN